MKRTLSMLLVLVLIFTVIPMGGLTASAVTLNVTFAAGNANNGDTMNITYATSTLVRGTEYEYAFYDAGNNLISDPIADNRQWFGLKFLATDYGTVQVDSTGTWYPMWNYGTGGVGTIVILPMTYYFKGAAKIEIREKLTPANTTGILTINNSLISDGNSNAGFSAANCDASTIAGAIKAPRNAPRWNPGTVWSYLMTTTGASLTSDYIKANGSRFMVKGQGQYNTVNNDLYITDPAAMYAQIANSYGTKVQSPALSTATLNGLTPATPSYISAVASTGNNFKINGLLPLTYEIIQDGSASTPASWTGATTLFAGQGTSADIAKTANYLHIRTKSGTKIPTNSGCYNLDITALGGSLVTVTASENAPDPLSFIAAGEGKTFTVTTVGAIDAGHPITLNVAKQGGASWLSLSQGASQYTAAGGITVTATASQNTGSVRTENLVITFTGDTGYYSLPGSLTVAISQAATSLVTITASENAPNPLSFIAAGEGKTFTVTTVGAIDAGHPITLNVAKQGGASWLSLSQGASQYTTAGGITVTATASQNTGALRTENLIISFTGDTGYYSLPSNLTVAVSQAASASGPVRAFPGAEGFGAYSIGGRGGDVYYVTNLNDTGAGSLRYGIDNQSGPRTIVFATGGTISLQSQLKVLKENLTIAGQTAPGDGITIKNYGLTIQADDTIVRYIRARVGDLLLAPVDGISISSGQNVIVDHCSVSWALDESLSVSYWTSGSTYTTLANVSVQWCIIAEPCDHNPDYDSGTRAGKGTLINMYGGAGLTIHHSIYTSVADRAPRLGSYKVYAQDNIGPRFDFRNNVLYNFNNTRPGYTSGSDHARVYSFVKNTYKAGPNTPTGGIKICEEYSPYASAYANGNSVRGTIVEGATNLFKNWSGVATWLTTEPDYGIYAVTTETAANSYTSVLADAGASKVRDSVDTRLISEISSGTSGQIIQDQNAVGGWPTLAAGTAVTDTDLDGMSNTFETANGLNINDASDRNGYALSSDYTNLEMYMNSLA